ncbi:MAG: aminoacyl-tRNA hydrolase, partial [Eggerthellaceae bacterium]|nr:aminoacyl-tRNA hydrolase [Eggerthellaceae bacterium]
MQSEKNAGSKQEKYLVVGLGNPGVAYAHTRHNAGFDTIDLLAEELGANYWKTECGAVSAKVVHLGLELVLAKPQGFMNTSGGPVRALALKHAVPLERLIIIHDDLDIEPGKVRVKFGGGHAGHNGLRSLCDKLGTREWCRVRVGIGRPPGHMEGADYVLQAPKKDDREDFLAACNLACRAVLCLVEHGLEK